ncbi:GNAT family N-acetyltransferase [Vibrio hannami]|uniref:GNAT family N-acetyltransferase n=1 Tax=Vibrio hannami TaxID=2717094 RepID=UPI00241050ED|nr:GNAT family N-acetyltransferase [Vibrio hannami]MDG3088158.1 GNAT family N-acetyltransferase [Vibrio hannami]
MGFIVNKPTIRPARITDLEELNHQMYLLHQYHHEMEPEHFKTPEEVQLEKNISSYLDEPECLIFVAEIDNKIVGFITGHFCELVSVISKSVQMGSIDELYVSPEYRNRGVAQRLFSRMENMFEDYGVKQVFVEVWDFNQAAVHFYKKMKFKSHILYLRKPLN